MATNRYGNRWTAGWKFADNTAVAGLDLSRKWEVALADVEKTLGSVAAQLMSGEEVLVEEQKIRIERVGRGQLRMIQFRLNGRMFEAIEQNPEKPSNWGKLAREKHQVVQFRDVETHKYVAVAVDGEVREYGKR